MSRRLALAASSLVLVAVLAVLAAATVAVAAPTSNGSARSASAVRAAGFPVSITASNGKVTLTRRPTRIVSLSPTATETLFAIGAGKQVVAVDDQSDYPKAAPRTALSGYTPNVEAIASYRPDLVVVAFDPKDLVSALTKLGIPVVFHRPATTLAGAYQQMRQLGKLTGRTAAADGLVRRMRERITAIVERRKGPARGATVYHELDPTFYSATSNTFVGRVYQLFGLRNVADAAPGGSDYPQLSPEFLIASDPDLIVLADTVCCGQSVATVASRPGWSSISAVKTRSVVRIDDSIASRWGPRLVDFVRAIGIALGRLSA